jgi:hypothetical protein
MLDADEDILHLRPRLALLIAGFGQSLTHDLLDLF